MTRRATPKGLTLAQMRAITYRNWQLGLVGWADVEALQERACLHKAHERTHLAKRGDWPAIIRKVDGEMASRIGCLVTIQWSTNER